MSSHTNVTVPGTYDPDVERRLKVELLECEKNFYKRQYEYLAGEFENIHRALEQWGYVDLRVGQEPSVRLILESENKEKSP